MEYFSALILALVQGLSEFLPISSSAHLILVPKFFGWNDQGISFDIAVHIGTLGAVLFFFKNELSDFYKDFLTSIKIKKQVGTSNLTWALVFGTLPVGICGLAFHDFISTNLRSEIVIALTTIVFGVFLFVCDNKAGIKDESSINIKIGLLIGVFQAIALIPGTSRSGITMSIAMLLGFSRQASAKFSFLLSIPVIFLAGGLEIFKMQSFNLEYDKILLGVIVSFFSAYLCMKWFMAFISKVSLKIFAIYRFFLGAFLIYVFA